MRFIIVGCGRVGAGLARDLTFRGHTVAVVDRDNSSFERLGPSFKGQTHLGMGIDREVLVQSGIERADGLAAVTASDETNVVVARIAREVFRVPRIVARVHDPSKVDIYRRLNLQVISPVTWGIQQITELLLYSPLDAVLTLSSGDVNIVEVEIPHLLAGRTVNELTVIGEIHVVAITREGKSFLPTLGTVLSEGDRVLCAVTASATERLKKLLGVFEVNP
jgi:trk system potassium uptake protein TrkA